MCSVLYSVCCKYIGQVPKIVASAGRCFASKEVRMWWLRNPVSFIELVVQSRPETAKVKDKNNTEGYLDIS